MKSSFIILFSSFLAAQPVFSQSNTPCVSGAIAAPAITVSATCSYQAGTTVGATTQTNIANGGTPSCGSMGEDVWYSFTAPASGSVQISTQAGSFSDGVMALYSGTCGSFTEISCSDDDAGLMPLISSSTLTPGSVYLIRFWQYGGGTGTFSICVQENVVLPLRLISFTGRNADASHILSWETADELNTSHFDLERGTDGNTFSPIARVNAFGAGDHFYTATDPNPNSGDNYYRLKSTDLDGKFTYSKTILLKHGGLENFSLSIYPNPSGNQLKVSLPAGVIDQTASITVYNLAGQELLQTKATGSRTTIDISRLKAGTYIVQWVGDKGMMQEKFVKAN